MTSFKATTLFLLGAALSFSACGQTNSGTKTAPAGSSTTTTTTKTTTTINKSVTPAPAKPAVVNKVPQTSSQKLSVKTSTTIKKTTAGSGTITKTTAPTKTTSSGSQPAKTTTTTTKTTTTGSGTSKTLPGAGTQSQTSTTNQRPGTSVVTPTTITPASTGRTTTTNTNTTTQTQNSRGGAINNSTTNTGTDLINTITQGDASSAIKEALKKGVQAGVDKVSVTNGYFGNSMIKIPFPAQVKQVESTMRSAGMGSLIDNAVLSMNRAAESAAKQAGPIFLNGITQMTVTDAVNIVSNKQPDAATQFLKRTTSESLVTSFKPSIKAALDKTLATKYWTDITTYYNKIPFVTKISTDLPDYVTRKAVDGLFYMVAQEEAKIRKDPGGQASEIIKDVFGKVKF